MTGHGPDAETFAKASAADTRMPHYVAETMTFMCEKPATIQPTKYARWRARSCSPDTPAAGRG